MIQNLKNSSYLKRIFSILTGSSIGQAVPFLLTPILAKLYTPEQYYELGLFILGISVFSQISTLRLEHAILIPKDDDEASALVSFIFKTLAIGSILVGSITFLLIDSLWALYLSIGILLIGSTQILVQYSNRLKKTASISVHKSLIGPGVASNQIVLKLLTNGLIIGKILGDLIASIPLIFSNRLNKILSHKSISVKTISKHYKNFPLINLPHSLFTILTNKAPLVVFGLLGLEQLSGNFEMVFRLGVAPIALFSSTFYLVFSERFSSKARNAEPITKLLLRNMVFLLVLVGIPLIIFSFFSPQLIPWILGEKWVATGQFFLYITPLLLATLLTSPFVYIFQYFNKQLLSLKLEILNASLKLIGLLVGLQISPEFGILFFALGAAIGYSIFMILTYKTCKDFDKTLI